MVSVFGDSITTLLSFLLGESLGGGGGTQGGGETDSAYYAYPVVNKPSDFSSLEFQL